MNKEKLNKERKEDRRNPRGNKEKHAKGTFTKTESKMFKNKKIKKHQKRNALICILFPNTMNTMLKNANKKKTRGATNLTKNNN